MQLKPLFSFLNDLADHNQRDWFQTHKTTYQQLRAQFELEVEHWFRALAQLDPALAGPQGRFSIFRLHRDVRFSHNKAPFKTHFSAYFTASAGKDVDAPAYYVQLGPGGQTLIAGGLYQPDSGQLKAVRQEIDYNADALRDILAAPDFRYFFPELSGDALKRPPAGYPATHPDLDLLKFKSYIVSHPLADAQVLAETNFRQYVLDAFRQLVPFCQYLREAIG